MDWISATIVILSLGLSAISWLAKIRWSKEYKEVKEAQINFLRDQVDQYKDLNSPQLIEYFKKSKLEFEKNQNELRKKLETERKKLRELEGTDNDKERLKELAQENELLHSELLHRVKNNLAVISGLMELQSMFSNDESFKIQMKEIQSRVRSIAMVHEFIYDAENFSSIDFDSYINGIGEFHNQKLFINNRVNGLLHLNLLIPLSMLLNEVLSRLKNNGIDAIDVIIYNINGEVSITLSPKKSVNIQDLFDEENFSNELISVFVNQLDAEIKTGDSISIILDIKNSRSLLK